MRRLSSDDVATRLGKRDTGELSDGVIVTEGGRDAFVLLSVAAYARLTTSETDVASTDTIPDIDLDSVEWNR